MPIVNGILTPREPAIDLVRIISEGTYTSFPQALKEFVSNSYDADATRVDIGIDDDCNTIRIRDNGIGMTLQDFRDYFASIARSGKAAARTPRGRTVLGRVKIGRFGIGALAVAGIADRFVVRSSRKNSNEGFEASINLTEVRSHFEKGHDLSAYWKFDYRQWNDESLSTHFTEIQVDGLKGDIRSLVQRPGQRARDEFYATTRELSGVDELIWQLGLICPVAYAKMYPIADADISRSKDAIVVERARKLLKDQFTLFVNGVPVKRDFLLPRYDPQRPRDPRKRELLHKRGEGYELRTFRAKAGSPVHYEGYFVVQAQQLFPQELRGLLIRMRGVAVGWHRTFNISASALSTMLPCLSGEVWVEGLEEALQFDRESFREDHPLFIWLRDELSKLIVEENKHFRARSAKRSVTISSLRPPSSSQLPPTAAPAPATKQPEVTASTDAYIDPTIFQGMPDYITRLIPQANGCWERGWYEGCVLILRRLVETLIIELYHQRGWIADIRDKDGTFCKLQTLVDKVCGDGRIGLGKHPKRGLNEIKKFGDVAAHDHRVKVRKTDLEPHRTDLRLACERLVFITNKKGP
jgi:hypothetical protein